MTPGGEQRGPSLGDRGDRAVVEHAACRRGSVACASQSSRVGRRRPVAWKRVPTGSPASASATRSAAVEHDRDAGAGGDPGRLELGLHAAGADAGGAGPADADARRGRPRSRTSGTSALPGRARVGVVQPVDVGEQHQQVGVDQVRDQRREPVVVAEPDLGGGDRVVLVDDRQHAELEQLGEGLVGVAVVRAPGHVVDGEQHLAGDQAVPGELLGVAVHQQPLADRRRGLLGGERPRAAASGRAAPGPAAIAPEETSTTSTPLRPGGGQRRRPGR